MADRPIPLPPRTPTPPPDDDESLNRFQNSPTKSAFDPTSLSPMDENFPVIRYASGPGFATTTLPLSSADTNSIYSPMSVDSNASYGGNGHLSAEDAKGAFNFQPASMAKAPVIKSVRFSNRALEHLELMQMCRTLVKGEVTSTSTAVYPINSSSSPNLAHPLPCLIPSLFPR